MDTTHDAVLALLNVERLRTQGDTAGSCTGTTIDINGESAIMLTAAHCVVERHPNGAVHMPPRTVAPSSLGVLAGPDWQVSYDSRRIFAVADVRIHPQYDGTVESPFDIGAVRYLGATPTTPIIPALPPDQDDIQVGSTLMLLGYGETENSRSNTERQRVDKTVAQVSSARISYEQADGRGTCGGDSGGPAIYLTTSGERVAGVTAFGDRDCTMSGSSVRVSFAWGFVQGVLDAVPPALDCRECRLASVAPDNRCFSEQVDCATDQSPCGSFLACVAGCQDRTCAEDCVASNPTGISAYEALIACQCQGSCLDACAADPTCQMPTPLPDAGSAGVDAIEPSGNGAAAACACTQSGPGNTSWGALVSGLALLFLRRRARPTSWRGACGGR